MALPVVLGLLTGLLTGLLFLDVGCTFGSFASLNNNNSGNSNASNNNNNANSNNSNANNSNNSNSNNTNGLSLSGTVNISSSHNANRSASAIPQNIRVDQMGNLYAVWEETDASGFDLQVKYATMPSGGSWSSPVQVSSATTGSPITAGTTRMEVHPTNGQVHIVWTQGSGSGAQIFASHNRSGSFATPFAVSTAAGQPASTPSLRVDNAGTAHYVWTRLTSPRLLVYRGLFAGTLDNGETNVSGQSGHGADDAFDDPDALVLLPGTTDQALGIPYLALVNGQQRVLYAERAAGSSGSFGSITDISLESGSTHSVGSSDASPRSFVNASGDLDITFKSTAFNGVKNTRLNGRPRSGSFNSTAVNFTNASAGDSSNSTAPIDLEVHGLLDGAGGLHLAWEDSSGSGLSTFEHRYLPSPNADSTAPFTTAIATTTVFAGAHALAAALDSSDSFFLAWEGEDSAGLRDLFVRRRSSGTSGTFDSTTQITTTLDSHLRGFGVTSGGRAFVLGEQGSVPDVVVAARETSGSVSGPSDASRQSGLPSTGIALRVPPTSVAHCFWLTTFNGSQRDLMYCSAQ